MIVTDDVLAMARDTLLDPDGVAWTDAELLRYYNTGVRSLCGAKPDAYTRIVDHDCADGALQELPTDGIQLFDVPRNVGGPVIRQASMDSLDNADSDWMNGPASDTVKHFTANLRYPRRWYVYPPSDGARVEIVYGAVPEQAVAGRVAWNPDDLTLVTLTNNNRVATYAAPFQSGDPNPWVRSTGPLSEGKVYWEITVGENAVVPALGVAVAAAAPDVSDLFACSALFCYNDTGGESPVLRFNAGATSASYDNGTYPVLVPGDVVQFAFDIDGGKMYVGVNGSWLHSGNPEAGTGYVFSGIDPVRWLIFLWGNPDATSDTSTTLVAADFSYSVPDGYTAWTNTTGATEVSLSPVYTTALWAFVVGMAYAKNSNRQNLAKSNEFMNMFNTAVGLKAAKQREATPVVNTNGAQ